jgi:hypothetical protein
VKARLNERNVVELINKLQKLGLLSDGLLHTLDGREYLTTEHLQQQILEVVEESRGRIALVRGFLKRNRQFLLLKV